MMIRTGLVLCSSGALVVVAASCGTDDSLFGGNTGGSVGGTGGSTSSTGTGGSTSSSTSTSGIGGASSSTSGVGGGQGGSDSLVDCDGVSCSPTEVCCYAQDSFSCTTPQACSGLEITCDEPSDCVAPATCCHLPQGDFWCDENCQAGSSNGMTVCVEEQDCSGGPEAYCCPTMPGLPKVCMFMPCPP